jgi:cell division protein ZapE
VKGRRVAVSRAARGVAWFTFDELCVRPLGAADYLAIADRFHTVILAGIPQMGPEQRNEARRFNTLIDTLYEAHANLIASAAAPPGQLYEAGEGSFEFQRTVSRLMEMQTAEYIEKRRAE